MYILGLSCYYHDSAAALIKDGILIAAAQEERFSRKKHDSGFPLFSISFCLQQAGISSRDLDLVVFYEKPLIKFERIFLSSMATFPKSCRSFSEAMINLFDEKLWIRSKIIKELNVDPEKVLFTDHHMAHAASAFFCSPFSESAVLTVDGVGEWTTTTLGWGKAGWEDGSQNKIVLSREQRFPHSLGLLYSAFTAFLGFRVNNGEYKVMGMAPYGKPEFVDKIFEKIIRLENDGNFSLNMDYFSYHHSLEKSFSSKFTDLFGEPRKPDSCFITPLTDPGTCSPEDEEVRKNLHFANIAASIQKVTEEVILRMANSIQKETGLKKLCMAGGCALNSVANGRILTETAFEEVFIQPAAGDAGGALGAALYAYHILIKKPRNFVMNHAFWGREYSEAETISALSDSGIHFKKLTGDILIERTVEALVKGKVIGLFQGRFEWGPRALGNRSIIADPRKQDMKDTINRMIKFREPFRPFAPVVPEDRASEYFHGIDYPSKNYAARFMLSVFPWKEEMTDLAPAVNHMGTGRLQTLRREWNNRYFSILENFGLETDVHVLLNTSFNLRGEPIVASPLDALNTFMTSGIDHLALNNFWVSKQK